MNANSRTTSFIVSLLAQSFMAASLAIASPARATPPRVVDHAFSFDSRYDEQDADVLDYRYGSSQLPVRPSREAVAQGKVFVSANVHGPMARGDSLYVKWRDRNSGRVFEDTVDLDRRLPADIEGHRIHFVIKGAQLYVYLISPAERRYRDPMYGPEIYRHRASTRIYPD